MNGGRGEPGNGQEGAGVPTDDQAVYDAVGEQIGRTARARVHGPVLIETAVPGEGSPTAPAESTCRVL